MRILTALMMIATMAGTGHAKLVSQNVDYEIDGEMFQGYIVHDDSIEGQRPGVLVVHAWWGLNDYAKKRADQLAEMGYVAMAADMYGKGKLATDRKQASEWAGQVRGKPAMRIRSRAALDILAAHHNVDPKKLAAIGYCFGGTTVLELAYSGAPLAGIVSFHGSLTAPKPEDLPNIKASLLVCHGADDSAVSEEAMDAFIAGMKEGKLDWLLVSYGNSVHTFTDPSAGSDPTSNSAYNEKADKRSWQHMQDFFKEIFE